MTTKYGVFIEPGYLNAGIPYKGTSQLAAERDSVLNFKAPTAKRGKVGSSKFASWILL
jgi:hypothetical protein